MVIGKLTAMKVKNLTQPGRYNDGGGLYLQVRDADARSWLFRYKLHGRPRHMGLGPLVDVTLAEAREAAQRCRKMVKDKVDPIEQRRAVHAAAFAAAVPEMTFKEAAERYIKSHEASWKNEKHRGQWGSTLATYVYPVIGKKSVAAIETGDITKIIEPLWVSKAETATRVRGRIELDFPHFTPQGTESPRIFLVGWREFPRFRSDAGTRINSVGSKVPAEPRRLRR